MTSSGKRAAALDRIQYESGDGPCLTAAREHRPVRIPDARASRVRPDDNAAAVGEGPATTHFER